MKPFKLFLLLLIMSMQAMSQAGPRVPIASAADPTFPQWDYSSYLNESLDTLVPTVTGQPEVYSTIIITLAYKAIINNLSLYDYSGVFTSNPAWIYSINGSDTTFLGKFTGEQSNVFTNIPISFPLISTKIAIKKFSNNIPEKVRIYGVPYQSGTASDTGAVRIPIDTIIPSLNTGMNYQPWMTDSLSSMVASVWGNNIQYIDVKLKLKARSQISKISLYDYTGVFTTNPAYVYLLKDTSLRMIGTFEGLTYQQYVPYPINEALQADAVVIRKYGNNIPQKVQIYGRVLPTDPFAPTAAAPVPPPATDTVVQVTYTKIPIDSSRWYILNYAPTGIRALFNGVTTENINTGFASFLPTYDCIYPLNDGESISISQVKMYDYNGIFTDNPAKLFAIKKDGRRIQLGTFTGSKYNQWVGPYPDRNTTGAAMFNLDSTITDIQYIGITCTRSNLPTEIEFYGAYTPPATVPAASAPASNFSKTLGMNAFEWDFVRPDVNARLIAEDKYAAIKNFRGFRHYLDWKQLEATEGKYTFNPSNGGGWDYDMTYARCKRDSIEVLTCIQNIPDWMKNTYPDSMRFTDNAPMKYGMPKDSVRAYIEKGRMAFQFTARYGRNANVPLSLVKVNPQPRWTADPPNVVKVGLGLVKYLECGNELDKWWKGSLGYMNCYQYAALLSAFYDGHLGTLGSDVGVKNADSTMQVVMCGLAGNDPSYVRGMIEWCRQNRGYKPDGTVNICWDVINYHHYSNDVAQSQQATATRGAAPELSNAIPVARSFVSLSQKYMSGIPVWITELGFDLNQGSPQKAIAIGDKTVLQTQADWILRSSLTYLREGISSLFFYELKDFNINNATKFASMGLTDSFYQRRPAMDYLYQANQLIGSYHFNRSLQQLPSIDEYVNNGNFIYAVWVPKENGTTMPCSLSFPAVDSVIIYRPGIGGDNLRTETVAVVNGTVQLTATETPMFVAIKPNSSGNAYVNGMRLSRSTGELYVYRR